MKCNFCSHPSVKKGIRNAIQKWFCKNCKKHFQSSYINKRCTKEDETMIIKLNNEGVGINGIARITGMSKANVVVKIRILASRISKIKYVEEQQEYEVDEMYTFIKNKNTPCYITYALNKNTKEVIDFVVGSRNRENIGKVINTLKLLNPKKIFTDKLNVYPSLIEKSMHTANAYKINHIERYNLTLRTHLKRLTRKTICFSKSINMLENCLRIYLY